MQTWISILRGINVGGQKKVLMADLKRMYEQLQFTNVETYIQSGNVIFTTAGEPNARFLILKIEEAIEKNYRFHAPVILRTKEELSHILDHNPFLLEENISTDKLHVTFLGERPDTKALDLIKSLTFSPDRFIAEGKEIYLHIPGSYGTTKLSNNYFENRLKVNATTRNWKTVRKLAELARQAK